MPKKTVVKKPEQETTELITDKRTPGPFRFKTFQIVLFLVVLIAVGSAVFFFLKFQNEANKAKSLVGGSASQNAAQLAALVRDVGKLMELPIDENPTVATVTDIGKLSGQAFFAKAKNGDKVLIYQKAGQAILYRPSVGKIINVAPYTAPATAQTAPATSGAPSEKVAATPTKAPAPKVVILNGTKTSGLTRIGEAKIDSAGIEIQVVSRGNSKEDHEASVVVDLTGSNVAVAQKMASTVGGKVGALPEGEIKPAGADILIILGADFSE